MHTYVRMLIQCRIVVCLPWYHGNGPSMTTVLLRWLHTYVRTSVAKRTPSYPWIQFLLSVHLHVHENMRMLYLYMSYVAAHVVQYKNQSFYSLWCHTCINDIGTLATTVAYTDTHTVQMCAHTKDVSITQSARQSSQQSDEVIVFGLSPAIYKYGPLNLHVSIQLHAWLHQDLEI